MSKPAVTSTFLFLALGLSAQPALTQAPASGFASETAAYEKQITELTARYEVFQIAAEADPAFQKNWLNRLRITGAIKPLTAATPNFTLSVGNELLLAKINPYVRRSDDDSTIAYLQALSKIVAKGVSDETLCKSFLNMADKSTMSDSDNARIEAAYGPALFDEMTIALGKVMRTGATGKERVLTQEQSEALIIELVTVMMDKYGKESAVRLVAFNKNDTPPLVKCETMKEMMTSIALLEKPQQAMLTRTLFASEGN